MSWSEIAKALVILLGIFTILALFLGALNLVMPS